MPWIQRKRKRYFYARMRQDGRVVSKYLGADEAAERAAEAVEARKAARQELREQERAEEAVWLEFEEALRKLEAVTTTLARATLEANGCHTHKGQWRRKRDGRRLG